MADLIKHAGIIEQIEGNHLQVRIIQLSACASCGAKGLCKAAESKEKLIDVYSEQAADYRVWQEVELVGTTSMGMKAIRYAFVLPLALLFIALLATYGLSNGNEPLAAMVGLGVLVPYYGVLYMLRKRLATKFTFNIKPINQ